MKRLQRIGCLLVMMLMVLVLAGCGAKDEWETAMDAAKNLSGITEDAQLRADTEKLLDALITDDYQAAWDTIYQEMDAREFRRVYVQLLPILRDIDKYELVASNINKNVRNGEASVSIRYMMTAGELRMFVDVARTEGLEGLTAFRLTEYVPVVTTGTLVSMQGADGWQWTLLIVGMLEIIFVICVFVDCCRHRMRRKWLWLLLVALGGAVFSVIVTPEQFRTGMNIGAFLTYTSMIRYSTGGFVLRIVIPVGAIVYLCCRKTLFIKYEQYQQKKAMKNQQEDKEADLVLPTDEQEADTQTE